MSRKRTVASVISIVSLLLTILCGMIIHAVDFGLPAVVLGIGGVLIFTALWIVFRLTQKRIMLWIYSLLALAPIMGFGFFNGFWNHVVKVLLFYLHNQELPSMLASLFLKPVLEPFFIELTGVCMFVFSLIALFSTGNALRFSKVTTAQD